MIQLPARRRYPTTVQIKRAIQAARASGVEGSVAIRPDGTIVITPFARSELSADNDFDQLLAEGRL